MTADDAAGTPASAEITGFAGKNEAADATGDADGVFQLPSTSTVLDVSFTDVQRCQAFTLFPMEQACQLVAL